MHAPDFTGKKARQNRAADNLLRFAIVAGILSLLGMMI
jgi:hypothetical protein